jgi:hypothetical protein
MITKQTPWGPAQHSYEIAPGITSHVTASHGGFELSMDRWRDLTAAFHVEPWAGIPWLEQDCDASLAVIRWPHLFSPEAVFCAVRQVQSMTDKKWLPANEWLHEPYKQGPLFMGETARATARLFQRDHAGQWERGSLSTRGNGWMVDFTCGTYTQTITLREYPSKTWYTTEELTALAVDGLQCSTPNCAFAGH